ncbi:hypothetical protein [Actibacterium pelagium]|uniref:Glycine zipper domain-containing protein n=1 Tax=Actibacterium pelagium TaxID=2029103 RepID=A0A917AHG5_9RHOB|nr:hypothetical protein [Actibacterium pelagium]GGE51918.1 hypothetical protein GCM10011517_19550 [Actibacterium pelagium]
MADRPYFRKLISAALVATLALSACNTTTPEPEAKPALTMAQNEQLLRQQAEAMQKTILEGAIAGAAVGGGGGFVLSGGSGDSARRGANFGLFAGAAAGTYVAFIQRKYIRRERRLDAIKEDLDKNAIEMQTTINVMRDVLVVQKAELAALQARAAAGEDVSADLGAEVTQAQANLAEMEKAISGATNRQVEFGEARGLTLAGNETLSPIDPELAALSEQIAAMKAIAQDLSQSLGEA